MGYNKQLIRLKGYWPIKTKMCKCALIFFLQINLWRHKKKRKVRKEDKVQDRKKISLAFHTRKGEGKTDSLSKQDALIEICSLLQQIPCETLRLICGEAGTNAHSTVSKQHTKKSSSLILYMSANSYCFCLISWQMHTVTVTDVVFTVAYSIL